MLAYASYVLFAGAAVGLTLLALQLYASLRHMRERLPIAPRLPGISILKPLCGHDDDLEANLEHFAQLPYDDYELVLGVRSPSDTAYPVALACAARHPARVRVIVQRGEPGLNPKVNQLVTLAQAARHDILVVSDSNVQVRPGYLREIAAELADERVGLVTHPVVGVGERRLGSLLDNLHLAGSVGAGMIGAKRVARKDFVVGKSMALRRRDLERLGGFEVVADVLAEDWVMGKLVPERLGKKVVMGRRAVLNISRERSVGEFLKRYQRWAVIHRQAVGGPVYTAQVLLNPFAVALVGCAMNPTLATAYGAAAFGTLKIAYDLAALRVLRGERPPVQAVVAVPIKDLLLLLVWVHGLVRREIVWRNNRLRVLPGTALERPAAANDRGESAVETRAAA
jgi:ceramide glucosyltransferase